MKIVKKNPFTLYRRNSGIKNNKSNVIVIFGKYLTLNITARNCGQAYGHVFNKIISKVIWRKKEQKQYNGHFNNAQAMLCLYYEIN